ncbi:hypothetical protein [Mariniflexile sp.]|uniref:hypothetical protein n=1 Tax=Mariniflexile sp. TaxID=1979402 RepID=UPI004047C935
MKNLLKHIIVFVLTLTIFNCSKNDDGGSNAPNENIRLKTYGIDTNEYDITYSTEGKPTGFETSSGTNIINNIIIYNDNNQIIQMGNITYTYNGQGRIATVNRVATSNTTASTIAYNNEGQIAVINTTSNVYGNSKTTMEYEGTKLKTVKEYNGSNASSYSKMTLEYDANNNIRQLLFTQSADDITYENELTYTYTYDTKINPYYFTLTKTGISTELNMLSFIKYETFRYNAYDGLKYYSKNNILSYKRIGSDGTIYQSDTYDYVNNDNNLPISAERQVNYSTGGSLTIYYNWTYETY